jgi:hypothetical protein
MEFQERINHCCSTVLSSLVNDPKLIIDSFDFGEAGDISDEGSSSLEIYYAPDITNLGNLHFIMRYS